MKVLCFEVKNHLGVFCLQYPLLFILNASLKSELAFQNWRIWKK